MKQFHTQHDLLSMTVDIVKSKPFIGAPENFSNELTNAIKAVYQELKSIAEDLDYPNLQQDTVTKTMPTLEELVGEDFVLCLEDNTKHKSLKRYLKSKFGLSWDQYKTKHGLPKDTPSCSLSLTRSTSARMRATKAWKNKYPFTKPMF